MPTLNNRGLLEAFIEKILDFGEVSRSHTQLVPYFGYYLSEVLGETDITTESVRQCYEFARISPPANIADVFNKSKAFVRTKKGLELKRDIYIRISAQVSAKADVSNPGISIYETASQKERKVVVVHGRDAQIRDDMFQFLRSMELTPIEWDDAVRSTGQGSPYTGDVVKALFSEAQAILVLLTPDEFVELRADLRQVDQDAQAGWQPRPNVFIEAGMALALDEAHTIFVEFGQVRGASDLLGRNVVLFNGSSTHRHRLAERLKTAGCSLSTGGTDWLSVGKFNVIPNGARGKKNR